MTIKVTEIISFTIPSQLGEIEIMISMFGLNNALSGLSYLKSYRYTRFVYSEETRENALFFFSEELGFSSPVSPRTPQWESGQVKIFSHAIEVLSHWVCSNPERSSIRILVVGSGGSDVLTAGRTYPLLRHVLKIPCIMDCYDPQEKQTETIIYDSAHSFSINYFKEFYKYDDMGRYDLVFDDTWEPGNTDTKQYVKVLTKMAGVDNVSVKGPAELLEIGGGYG